MRNSTLSLLFSKSPSPPSLSPSYPIRHLSRPRRCAAPQLSFRPSAQRPLPFSWRRRCAWLPFAPPPGCMRGPLYPGPAALPSLPLETCAAPPSFSALAPFITPLTIHVRAGESARRTPQAEIFLVCRQEPPIIIIIALPIFRAAGALAFQQLLLRLSLSPSLPLPLVSSRLRSSCAAAAEARQQRLRFASRPQHPFL